MIRVLSILLTPLLFPSTPFSVQDSPFRTVVLQFLALSTRAKRVR